MEVLSKLLVTLLRAKNYLGNKGLSVVGPVMVGAMRSSSIISSVSSSPAYEDDDFVGDCKGKGFLLKRLWQSILPSVC